MMENDVVKAGELRIGSKSLVLCNLAYSFCSTQAKGYTNVDYDGELCSECISMGKFNFK